MTRQLHDQFAKQYLEELLAPLGQVETSKDVSPEVRQVDVWFVPAPSLSTESQLLGLLGQMASSACSFEPFRNQPNPFEVRNCLLKLYSLHGELLRKARRENNSLSETELPILWILSPTCSENLLNGFGAKLDSSGNWVEGVYFLPEYQKTALVAINQLPQTEATLWLRIMGRRETQKQAVREIEALPSNHPFRRNILEIIGRWYINLQTSQNLDEEDREVLMNLSPAYLKWREDTLQEGRREMVENLLQIRFGVLDEVLAVAIPLMLQLPSPELTRLLLTLSREELLERFGGGSN
ncbi:MAG TPA: flagellar assembly protein H [Leptolyngbyaceae cyanobacterium]